MPVYSLEKTEKYTLGIWKISESLTELESLIKLPENDKNKYDGFKSSRRKKEWLISRILTNELTGKRVNILYDEHGKPQINNELHISISHSHDFVAIIISEKPVGIDIEKITERIRKIEHKFISTKEQRTFDSQTEQLEHSYKIWCAKEALFKITPMKNIIFTENLFIKFNDLQGCQHIIGEIRFEKNTKTFPMWYKKIEDNILVWTLGD